MVLSSPVGEPRLELRDVAKPVLAHGEVLVRAAVSGVNRADLLQRRGSYRQVALDRGLSYTIAGMEIAGVVSGIGPGVEELAVGDRVMTMCAGSYAEYVAVDQRLTLPVPDGLDWTSAAALPVATMTAYDALARCARLTPSETVLVTAASSAVGLITLQVAKLLGAARVVATTRDPGKSIELRASGADDVIIGGSDDLASELAGASAAHGVDVVIDHVGGAAFPALIASMAPAGRYVSVGRLSGQRADLDLNTLARQRLTLVGATFRTRTIEQYAEIVAGVRTTLLPAIEAGALRAHTAAQYPLDRANDALDELPTPRRIGKVTLSIDEPV